MARTLETILVGRDLLSPTLSRASGSVRTFDQSVTGSMTRTTAAVEGGTRRQSAAMQQLSATATAAAANLQAASTRLVAARERESVAAARVTAAEERLAALRASGTASGLRLALAEDNVAQATLAASAAQQRRVTAAAQLSIADRALTAANDQLVVAQERQVVASTRQAAGNQRVAATSTEATVAMRTQQAAVNGLAASNGLLGTSMTPLTAGLGAVALGLGYAGFRGMQFDSAMSQVQAATMATGGELESLRDLAIELGGATQYSAEEAAQGITELAKAGVSTGDILNGGLAGALDLAAAGQLEVADAAEIAATQMTVFGLAGDQTSHVADLLAAGAGKAQGSVQDMALALQYAGLPAAGLGLSIEETTGALGLFASNGLVGEKAGTAFRGMLVSLTNPAGTAQQTMSDLNLEFFDAQGNFIGMAGVAGQLQDRLGDLTVEQRNAALAQLFGNEALGAAQALYTGGQSGVRDWIRNVNDAGFAAEQAAMLNDNLRGDLEKLGGAFDSAMTSIGAGAQGPLRLLVQSLTAVIEAGGDVIGFLQELPTGLVLVGAAIAAYLLVGAQMLAQLAALRMWATANLFSPLIVGFMTLLAPVGGYTVALATARTALLGFLSTAAPFIATAAIAAGVVAILQAERASTAAREAIEDLLKPVADANTNTERIAAQAGAIDGLRTQVEQAQAALADFQNDPWWEKAANFGLRTGQEEELQTALDEVTDALERQTEAADRSDQSIDVLARRYGLSRDAVIEFADAHGIDLSGSLQIAQTDFMRLADAAGLAQNTTSTATAAAGSYGALLAEVGAQAQTSADDLQDWLDMVRDVNEGFIDPLSTYTELLAQKKQAEQESAQATADATADQTDSWQDYVQDVSVSLSEYQAQLQTQIDNQRNWQTNLALIAQRGGLEVATALMEMGVEGADIVAQMATANEAEFTGMASTLIAQAQLAGAGSNQAMSNSLQIMAEIGHQGATATAQSIATALGVGVEQVRATAAGFGIVIAEGVNPVLTALGKPVVALRSTTGGGRLPGQTVYNANGNILDFYANGGVRENHIAQIANGGTLRVWAEPETGGESYIPLAPSKRARSMDIWRETGKRLNAPEAVFFANGGFTSAADVPPIASTAPFGPPLSTAAQAAMQAERDAAIAFLKANTESVTNISGGPAGSTAIGGGWQTIWNIVKAAIPQARINSTFRPGDPGYHGRGKAIDFGFGSGPGGAGSAGLASIARFLYTGYGRTLAELIYDGVGDNTPDVKNGRDHTYNAATQAQHRNHVHAAVYANGGLVEPGGLLNPHVRDSGGPLLPGFTYNGLGRPETVVPTAAAAMPGYGSTVTNNTVIHNVRNYDISVTAGAGADSIANTVIARLRTEEYLNG